MRPAVPAIHPTENCDADRNWRRFVLFRVFFNARFYYPVLAILFLDLGLSATDYTLLNFVWALTIVAVDLPAGLIADRIGRRPLVVAAAFCMVVEMILLIIAPHNGGWLLLLCCLANRITSGVAEGMANGADEALVFDSLAERGRSEEWPKVLEQVTRWQSLGFVVAMLVGGAVYDPALMSRLLAPFLGGHQLVQSVTLRFPIYLTFITALVTLALALGMREPKLHKRKLVPGDEGTSGVEVTAWKLLYRAGTWILRTPVALFTIVAGVCLDSTVRLFLTFSSSYFRIIALPESSFGLWTASLGGLGLVISPIARRLAVTRSIATNFAIVAALVAIGAIGGALRWNYWGVIFLLPFGSAMMILGYLVSYYLNALVDSSHRATVLSFKGLVFNLGYGFISLVFALVFRAVRDGGSTQEAVARGLYFLPLWLALVVLLCVVSFWSQRRKLTAKA